MLKLFKAEEAGLSKEIRTKPWNSHFFESPPLFANYPTMLMPEEMRMLAWIAANTKHPGDIADLGSFLGGSTVSLAHGVRTSGLKRKIHAYDWFRVTERNKSNFLYSRGHPPYEGEDAFPLFQQLTKDYSDLIHAYPGEFTKSEFVPPDISVLFVDIAKSWATNDFIVTRFFPKLTVGSIVVQQDFLFYKNPWLYSTMYKLRDKITYLSNTADYSVIYAVTKNINHSDVIPCLQANTSADEMRIAIQEAKKNFKELRQREMVDAVLRAFNATPNKLNSSDFKDPLNIRSGG